MTEAELIQEMEEALEAENEHDGFLSTYELTKAMSCGEAKVRQILRLFAEQGRLESRKIRVLSPLNGIACRIPVYRIKEEA